MHLHLGKFVTLKTVTWVQDGRDVPDGTSVKFVEQLEKDLEALDGVDARIASGGGRMNVTMDRYEVSPPLQHQWDLDAPIFDSRLDLALKARTMCCCITASSAQGLFSQAPTVCCTLYTPCMPLGCEP